MKPIKILPIAIVHNSRIAITDDHWGEMISSIDLLDPLTAETLEGIDTFSHLEVIYYFDQADEQKVNTTSRHPRGNQDWPKVGIFAQRGKDRPNHIGATIVKLSSHEGSRLVVQGLDALDGTPVLDIKPVMKEFLPQGEIRQPGWSTELMKDYWD